ncbi:MAG: O-antigen ligase family protein [Vulcanococcus sp.]|uniref:O-antigen ligase family protein n=1 Tax=Vulcanococcus sp. TaxID=2856995 RepID=UPI0025E75A7B|nr:O-antigen ligase family protein [Vulcanococcus sp.]MBW0166551.1 O-antigen ligase family protein [Vulcanococcus sp.]
MNSHTQIFSQADCWLDLCIPAATALLLAAQPLAAYSLVGFWLAARLSLQCTKQPVYLILLCLALTSMGTMVLERGSAPSDPSDLLIIALAFAAGVHRPAQRWHASLSQISLCLLPIAIAACLKSPETLLQFPDINVNRLSFLLGLLISATWGLAETSNTGRSRLAWLAWMSLALPLTLLSGSRAPLALPVLAIAIAKLIAQTYPNRTHGSGLTPLPWRNSFAALTLIVVLAAGATQLWYHNASDSGINRVSDTWRAHTALCWAKQPFSQRQPWLGLGHINNIRKRCDSDRLPVMQSVIDNSTLSEQQRKIASRAAAKGLPHAHNSYVQIFAETGIAGLAAVVIAGIWIARMTQRSRLKSAIERTSKDELVRRAALPIAIYLAITGLTTSFHIFLPLNQILIGYSLAMFSATPAEQERLA